ncbi:MAG: T9SS type A sorting domain-containing protein [Bacteroidales bacterium]|jgi:hypothetical protein|nr:T9SS type A sorting domain-containing protein [Bacteroidales bacterium]
MKKLYTFLLMIAFCVGLSAQSKALYISESFDEADFPEGWEILSWSTSNWSLANSNQAGGEPYEISMMWVPALTGTTGRLGSPVIDLSNHNGTLILEFQYLVQNMGECLLGVATTSNNGNTWNIVYEKDSPQYPSPIEYASIEINSPDVGSENFRFCFFFHSDETGMTAKRWAIDNVILYSLVDYDAQLLSIDGIAEAVQQGWNEVAFTFANKGRETITSIEASYQFDGMSLITETFNSLSIAQNEIYSLTFSEKTSLTLNEDYTLTVKIDKINGQDDQEPANNSLNMNLHAYTALGEKRLLIDHFTSSTCSPCPSANQAMSEFLDIYSEQTVISKYQMNWPGIGDPYYNADGGLRKVFYEVESVPKIFFNGNILNTFNFESFFKFYFAKQIPILEIRGAFNIDDTNVNIDFNIVAYEDLENLAVYVSVNEKHTTGNVGNNGETDFYHVMMKMLPDGNGTSTSFEQFDPQNFTFQYDLSNTFVEEYDDLEVVVFVQDPVSKTIYNGNYLLEKEQLDNIPPKNLQLDEFLGITCFASWEAPFKSGLTGYNVYINDELVASDITETSYTFQTNFNELYIVKVSAVYDNGIESVRIADYIYTSGQGINRYNSNVRIYPNPADDYVIINSDKNINRVEIYNNLGQLIDEVKLNNVSNAKIITGKYSNGIYILKISFEDNSTSSQKIVIK